MADTLSPLPAAASAVADSGFAGTVVLCSGRDDTWQAGDPERALQRFIPASTFKVLSTLAALDTGVAAHADALVHWDGRESSRPVIDRNMTLREAFRLSAVPHYQAMVRSIGAPVMQEVLDDAGYGNRDLSGGVEQFWLTGGLRISPVEQIGFLRRLYRGRLPFSVHAMATVRDIMTTEVGDDYRIRAKTGWAVTDDDLNTGWWTGWVEKADNVYFFASVLQSRSPGTAFGPARLAVVRKTLQARGILPS